MLSLRNIKFPSISAFSLIARSTSVTLNARLASTNEKYDKIGFIGTGNMARAIISGLISKNKFKADQIYFTDNDQEYVHHLRTNVPLFKVDYLVLEILFIHLFYNV